MAGKFNLFGEQLPDNYGERGRPQHVATDENRNVIMVMLAQKRSQKDIAAALDISVPTLRTHYSSILAKRGSARQRLVAWLDWALVEAALGGNVGAQKLCRRVLEEQALDDGARRMMRTGLAQKSAAPAAPKLGKKELRLGEAESGHRDTDWDDLVEPPSPDVRPN